jgi:ABC-type multidrug transport system fused ATPase/permease subunit
VLLAGDDLALLPLSEVRRQVVVVPREPLVVSGTVRQNLDLLGKAQGDWEIWAALEQCFFADTVRSWPGISSLQIPSSLLLLVAWGADEW